MILILDEHFPQDLAAAVRRERPKFNISSVHEKGFDGVQDEALLEILDDEKTTLVTRDVNTIPRFINTRLASGQTHGGVVYVSRKIKQNDSREVIRRLVKFIDENSGEDWQCRDGWL